MQIKRSFPVEENTHVNIIASYHKKSINCAKRLLRLLLCDGNPTDPDNALPFSSAAIYRPLVDTAAPLILLIYEAERQRGRSMSGRLRKTIKHLTRFRPNRCLLGSDLVLGLAPGQQVTAGEGHVVDLHLGYHQVILGFRRHRGFANSHDLKKKVELMFLFFCVSVTYCPATPQVYPTH